MSHRRLTNTQLNAEARGLRLLQTSSVLIRQATYDDLEELTDLRLQFLADHRKLDPTGFPEAFRSTTRAFLERHHEAGTSLSWLAEEQGSAIGAVTMLLLDLAPRPEDQSGRDGYIINMFVSPPHRATGVGHALLRACLEAGQQLALRRLLLHATDEGRPLYLGAGFTPNPNWMERPMPPLERA